MGTMGTMGVGVVSTESDYPNKVHHKASHRHNLKVKPTESQAHTVYMAILTTSSQHPKYHTPVN